MKLPFFEGFDLYDAAVKDVQQGMAARSDVWSSRWGGVGASGHALQPRDNGNAIYLNSGTSDAPPGVTWTRDFDEGVTNIAAGIAFKSENFAYYSNDGGPTVLAVLDARDWASLQNGRVQCRAETDPENTGLFKLIVSIREGSDTTIAQSFTIEGLSHDIWHYVEIVYKTTNGRRIQVFLNGNEVVDYTPTKDGNIIQAAGMSGSYSSLTNRMWYDDMYALNLDDDTNGPTFQQRLGPIQIRPCPLNADSTPSSWVASSGGAKYLDVDEQPGPNDLDATYISTVSAPQTQMFKCSPYDADLPIIAMTSFASVKQPDPTNSVAQFAFMVDDQEDSSPLPLQNSYRLFSQNYVTLPGGALSVPVIEATEFGVRSIEGK